MVVSLQRKLLNSANDSDQSSSPSSYVWQSLHLLEHVASPTLFSDMMTVDDEDEDEDDKDTSR
jgi:hypothetical protein